MERIKNTIGKKSINMDKKRPNLLFVLGGPGTGKTTQCKLIAQKFNFDYFTLDEILFDVKQNENRINLFEGKCSKDGLEEIFEIILSRAKKPNILLESFLSTENDFLTWKKPIKKMIHIVGAFYFHCPEEMLKYRLYNRDNEPIDNIKTIIDLVNSYKCENKLIDELEKDQKIILIKTNDSIENTFKEIQIQLKAYNII